MAFRPLVVRSGIEYEIGLCFLFGAWLDGSMNGTLNICQSWRFENFQIYW